MKDRSLHYLSDKCTEAEREAFVAGCRTILTLFRNTTPDKHPSFWSSVSSQHIAAILLAYNQQVATQRNDEACLLINNSDIDKLALRSFIFDVAKLNDRSQELEETTGMEIESAPFFINNTCVYHRPSVARQAIHKVSGNVIKITDYDQLPPHLQAQYEIVRYLDVTFNGNILISIRSNDYTLMSILIRQDILINDEDNNYRYLLSVADGNVLEGYRNAVINSLTDLGHQSGFNPMLLSHAKQGTIKTGGHLIIAQMQSIINSSSAHFFLNSFNPAVVDTWLDIFKACDYGHDSLSPYLSNNDFFTYRSIDGLPLFGAFYDNSGDTPKWTALPSSDKADDYVLRSKYFRHFIIPEFQKKLLAILDAQLPQQDPGTIRPDRLRALLKLANYLTEQSFIGIKYPNVTKFITEHSNL